jgi:hypothetical protein
MKKYRRVSLIVGAAVLQTVCFGNPESSIAQSLAASEQTIGVTPTSISPVTAEVTRLAQSGVSDEALIAFVKQSQQRFGLSEETIAYLKDLGLAPEVIAAMIEHDGELAGDSRAPDVSLESALTSNSGSAAMAERVPSE